MTTATNELQERTQAVLTFITDYITQHGYAPTRNDIMTGCGISSKSVVQKDVQTLADYGFIKLHPEIARGITIPPKNGQQ